MGTGRTRTDFEGVNLTVYHAKKPKKKRLTVKVEKCWRIVIQDETEQEIWDDFWFGSKEDAQQIGNAVLKKYEQSELLPEKNLLQNMQKPALPLPAQLFMAYNHPPERD